MRASRTSGHRSTKVLAAALLTASLAVGGCGAGDDSGAGDSHKGVAADSKGGGQEQRAPGTGSDTASGAGAQRPAGPAGAKKPPLAKSHVIRTATLSVEVESATKALATAHTAAENAGGIVGNETTERIDDSHVYARIVLRVPQEEYDGVLKELSGTGKLLSRKANAKDVTEQVVDVESRVKSQRTSVARVRDMMDRATKISDVVMLEGELNTRQTELEALLAQQASLKDRTSLATITLELSEPEAAQRAEDEDPGFLDALAGGWDAFVTTLKWVAMVLGAVAPFAAALALLYVLWRLLRGRLPQRRTAAPAPAPATGMGAMAAPFPSAGPATGAGEPAEKPRPRE
ncbi:hypothetical protein AR457_08180 [Streptomyces agglomeratus]|uniref:DUF4349 domain-containing protein n=1 Tax=Streptomyces agglomeratus TaxID=285458 RepID=A0A1E5P4P8_9ACTN|nr:DUF4349 domain-containing protein [Streptomyces agglomeratus]OEJ24511.1 hypothetical protein AS594_08420 [Streptomyces agglomeratus]OEJ41537.1 hypothetical protein BGK70_28470 [Streptomyces agglomeratus]OEJ44084.1 hypothetical protein AR457_08180 [Streptomyces agglomeratus]OEJ54027.1 hypothetical protein BGK72_27765 [Streptomyces agglomeratus]OEJ61400.1 hypothetical protein BGM19_28690 [Streptomyces agglomeratus]